MNLLSKVVEQNLITTHHVRVPEAHTVVYIKVCHLQVYCSAMVRGWCVDRSASGQSFRYWV